MAHWHHSRPVIRIHVSQTPFPLEVTILVSSCLFQSNCRLFLFDTMLHSWREKGRGVLRLNDMCQSMTEGIFQSRLGKFFFCLVAQIARGRERIRTTAVWYPLRSRA